MIDFLDTSELLRAEKYVSLKLSMLDFLFIWVWLSSEVLLATVEFLAPRFNVLS